MNNNIRTRHNWKSDLSQTEKFYERNSDGILVKTLIPDDAVDFQLIYATSKQGSIFVASRIKGRYSNCEKIDASTLAVYIPLSRHHLGIGDLCRELILTTINDKFQDNICNIVVPGYTGMYLWDGPTDKSAIVDSEIISPVFVKYLQSYLPYSRIKKDGKSNIRLSLTEPCPIEVQQQLYVGVFHKSSGKWRLACDVKDVKYVDKINQSAFVHKYPVLSAKLDDYRLGFRVSPTPLNTGALRNVIDLFKLEFAPMSVLGDIYEKNKGGLVPTGRSEFFIGTRKNSKLMHGVSRHNPTEYYIKNAGESTPAVIDKTYKGAKQIVKRHYKVGIVRPSKYNVDGTPNWGAYHFGELHDIMVIGRTTGRKQGAYISPQTEIYIEMK